MDIIVNEGYTFNYFTSGGDVGGFANINKPDGLKINIEEIGGAYHCSFKLNGIYHCSFKLNGIYIQIWCKSYEIRRING